MNYRKIALRTLERIETHPEHYDQSNWIHGFKYQDHSTHDAVVTPIEDWGCGTTACVAGHAVAAMIELYPEEEYNVFKATKWGGYSINFEKAGMYALGIDDREDAYEIFKVNNSYANVVRQLEELAFD